MISDRLVNQVKFEEGFRSGVYLCPAGKRTIGYGRNLDANPYFEGKFIPDRITRNEAEAILRFDLNHAAISLAAAWRGYGLLQGARQDALIQMAYQLGLDGLLGFRKMHEALLRSDWQRAYGEALDSKWAKRDSPARAKRVAGQFLTGEYYEIPL